MEGEVWIRSKKRMRHVLPRAALGFLFLGQPGDAFLFPGLRRYAAKGAMGHMSAGGFGARQRRSRSPILGAPMMAEGNGPNGGMPSDGMKIPPSLLDEASKSDEGLLPGEGPFPAPDPKLLDKRARKEAVRKTEMWKDLWMRNVASNAADAGHHTFNFMNSGFSSVSSTFQPIMSSITNKLNILDWEWKMGPDHYEEVLIDSIAYDSDGQGQIVEYDPAFLSRVGWATNLKGTVWSIASIYWQFMWLMVVAIIYALLSGPAPLVLDTMGAAAPVAGKLTLRLPSLKAQTFAVSLVGGLLSFLLSLFNSNGLDRWWKTRDCLGVVIGRSIDVAMMFSMYIRGYDRESDEVAYFYKCELIRYLNLAHILVYRQANSIDDLSDLIEDHSYNPPRAWITQEEMLLFQPDKKPKPGQLGEAVRRRKFFAQQLEARPRSTVRRQTPSVPEPKAEPKQESPILLQQSPLITPTEPGGLISRYCIVYYWIEELLSKAAREGLIDTSRPEALWKMQENISKMRGAAADVFMYLYCKVPYIYVHLMTMLVKTYLIVIAAVAGSSLRMSWFLSRPADFTAAIMMVFFMNLVYEGLLQIHIRLWNPLGFDINDYPQRRYQDYVWRATMQFLKKPEKILPSFIIPKSGLYIPRPHRTFDMSNGETSPDESINAKKENGATGDGIAVVPFGSPEL